MSERVLLAWSSGKDSAWTLEVLRRDPDVEVAGLLTTFNGQHDRVAMHAVRRSLVHAQARAAGLALVEIDLPWPCPNEVYEREMAAALARARRELDISRIAFGDLFLEDVRRYREARLAPTGVAPMFPIWGSSTPALAREMIAAGIDAVLTCIDPAKLGQEFAGRRFDAALLGALPEGVDPCGEHGEFHTFVRDGPMFSHRVDAETGRVEAREGFVFADLEPAGSPGSEAIVAARDSQAE